MLYLLENIINRKNYTIGLFDLPENITESKFQEIYLKFSRYCVYDIRIEVEQKITEKAIYNGPWLDKPYMNEKGRHWVAKDVDGKKKYADPKSKEWIEFLDKEKEISRKKEKLYKMERNKRLKERKEKYGDITMHEMFKIFVKQEYNINCVESQNVTVIIA